MTQSTSTLLQVVNKALLNVGERQITSFSSPISLKGLNAVEEALREIENLDDWGWTREVANAVSWDSEVATLPTFSRIHNAYYIVSDGYKIQLRYIDFIDFTLRNLVSFSGDINFPRYYTITNDNSVLIDPYPTSADEQNRLFFTISSSLVVPSLVTDTLPVPERYVVLVIKLASYNLAVRHLGDTQLASNFRSEFEASLVMLRNRGNLSPTTGTNMYRRRGRYQ